MKTRLSVRFDEQNVWLTQAAMAELFKNDTQKYHLYRSHLRRGGTVRGGNL